MAKTLYTTDILRMAANIPHLGRLESAGCSVERQSPICGSSIIVDVTLDAQGRVCDFAQQVRACALGQASAFLLGSHIFGRTGVELGQTAADLADWLAGKRMEAPDWPGMDLLAEARHHPGRHGSICLPFLAAAQAAQGDL